MRKVFLVAVAAVFAALRLSAQQNQVVTLPAAASIVGIAPFFSDVRAFNTSYTNSLNVTANYRCFLAGQGGSCTAGTSVFPFTLAPRQSMALNDIVAQTFSAPNTAGGVEFTYSGESEQLVVTSRLFSTTPTPTVGMFIPGLDSSEAFPTTILTSVRNGGPVPGFRTNVGLFNPNDSAVSVTFTIFDGGRNQAGNPVSVTGGVPAHSGAQVNAIFNAAGAGGLNTDNAVILVVASAPIFSYAAVIDNNTTDPYLVIGAQDVPQQPITPVGTTPTPTVPAPTATPTPPAAQTAQVNIGSDFFQDQASGNSTTTIHVGDSVKWTWIGSPHSTTSGSCSGGGCSPDGHWDSNINNSGHTFTFAFSQAGTFPYYCRVHLSAMTGSVVVQP
jgi:plastocyanin